MPKSILVFFTVFLLLLSSCKKEGCTDPQAENYSSDAVDNDGSCVYNYSDDTERLVASVNGSGFDAEFFSVNHENGVYNVSGTEDVLGISLSLPDSVASGALDASSANYVVTGGQEPANSGSYTYSIDGNEISGTFAFQTNSHNITNGEFKIEF